MPVATTDTDQIRSRVQADNLDPASDSAGLVEGGKRWSWADEAARAASFRPFGADLTAACSRPRGHGGEHRDDSAVRGRGGLRGAVCASRPGGDSGGRRGAPTRRRERDGRCPRCGVQHFDRRWKQCGECRAKGGGDRTGAAGEAAGIGREPHANPMRDVAGGIGGPFRLRPGAGPPPGRPPVAERAGRLRLRPQPPAGLQARKRRGHVAPAIAAVRFRVLLQPLQREPRRRGAAPVDRVARGAPAGARLPVQRPPARAVVQPGRVEVETPRSGSQAWTPRISPSSAYSPAVTTTA